VRWLGLVAYANVAWRLDAILLLSHFCLAQIIFLWMRIPSSNLVSAHFYAQI
jgi:hypothetical protein